MPVISGDTIFYLQSMNQSLIWNFSKICRIPFLAIQNREAALSDIAVVLIFCRYLSVPVLTAVFVMSAFATYSWESTASMGQARESRWQ